MTYDEKQRQATSAHPAADEQQPSVRVFGRRVPMPRSRLLRISLGVVLVILGCFGFLPVLGFWMIPFGLLILSYDIATVRNYRRRLTVWWGRRRNGNGNGNNGGAERR